MAAAGVDRALSICTTLEEFDAVHAHAMAHDALWCTVGVHPDNEGVREPTVQDLLCLLYTSDAAAERSSVGLGGRRIIKKKQLCKNKNSRQLRHIKTPHK